MQVNNAMILKAYILELIGTCTLMANYGEKEELQNVSSVSQFPNFHPTAIYEKKPFLQGWKLL